MTGTFLWLILRSARGRIVRWLKLLKQPKYLIGLLVGLAYFALVFGRNFVGWRQRMTWLDPGELGRPLSLAVALGVAVFLSIVWLNPVGRLGLALKEAELNTLLSAPLTRRRVLAYALLKSQAGILLTVIILALYRGAAPLTVKLQGSFGLWLMLTFIDVNMKLRGLFLLRQRELPVRRAAVRRGLLTLVLVAAWVAILFDVHRRMLPVLEQAVMGRDLDLAIQAADGFARSGITAWLLTPLMLLTRPIFATSAVELLGTGALALGMVALFAEGVLRSPARFEEAALDHARQVARQQVKGRRWARQSAVARRRHVFRLPPLGRPEIAIVWKNALQLTRMPWTRLLAIGAGLFALAAVVPSFFPAGPLIYGVVAIVGGIAALVQPAVTGAGWRNDLRADLLHAEMLRTWPLKPERLVLAEVLGPALAATTLGIGTGLAGLGAVFGSWLLVGGDPTNAAWQVLDRVAGPVPVPWAAVLLFVGIVPAAFSMAFLSAAIQNVAVLVFPAWIGVGQQQRGGVAQLGQRLIVFTLNFLALAVASLPSIVLVTLVFVVLGPRVGAWLFPVCGVAAALPVIVLGFVVIRAGGPLWKRLDPATELIDATP